MVVYAIKRAEPVFTFQHPQFYCARLTHTQHIAKRMDNRAIEEQRHKVTAVDEDNDREDGIENEIHVADAQDHGRARKTQEQWIGA